MNDFSAFKKLSYVTGKNNSKFQQKTALYANKAKFQQNIGNKMLSQRGHAMLRVCL